MEPFAQTVDRWHDFYIMVGTAAATLIGLLFVALSLNIELFRRADFAELLSLARETFKSFFYVLFFAIIFLIRQQTPLGLGIPFLVLGGLGLLNALLPLLRAWKKGRMSLATQRFIFPLVALIGVAAIAISVLMGQTTGLYWLVPVMLLLLATASRNAWDLLIGMRGAEYSSSESRDT